jgi:thioredoxin-like negative regulator of GroEL
MTVVQPVPVESAATPRPKLLFFSSATSGRSRRAEGFLAQVLQRRRNHETFQLLRIEAERHPDLVERFRVKRVPTLIVVDERKICARLAEPSGCRQITKVLSPWLK